MSTRASAAIVDLRYAFDDALPRAANSAGEGDGGETPPTDPPAPADAAEEEGAPHEGDDDAAEEGDGLKLTDEEIKNPRIKELSDENAKHRLRAVAEKKRADDAEAKLAEMSNGAGALRDARMENAFLRSAFGVVDDLDVAWKLADKTGVVANDDGTFDGIDAVITTLLDRYPYLRAKDPEPYVPLPTEPSGSANSGRRRTNQISNRAVLEKKFPALRTRRS